MATSTIKYDGNLNGAKFITHNATGYLDPNSTLKLHLDNYTRVLFLFFGTSTTRMGMLLVNVGGSGSIARYSNLGSDITINVSPNEVDITTPSSAGIYIHSIVFRGDISVLP